MFDYNSFLAGRIYESLSRALKSDAYKGQQSGVVTFPLTMLEHREGADAKIIEENINEAFKSSHSKLFGWRISVSVTLLPIQSYVQICLWRED